MGMMARELRIVSAAEPAAPDPLQAFATAIEALRTIGGEHPAGAGAAAVRQGGDFGERYARSCSLARRRIEAIALETEQLAAAGLRAMVAAQHSPSAATIAAARLLADTVADAVRRMETMLPPKPHYGD